MQGQFSWCPMQFLESEFTVSYLAVQMNLDPRLDIELGTPVLQEMQVPTAEELLSGPIQEMLGIQNKEDWQVCCFLLSP